MGLALMLVAGAILASGVSTAAAAINPFSVSVFPPYRNLCGAAVGNSGNTVFSFYAFHSEDDGPTNSPCPSAFSSTGARYVNHYHSEVTRFGILIDPGPATGVAVASAANEGAQPTDRVYVMRRSHVLVYEPNGAPVLEGGEQLRIGEGSIENGYGVAVSGFPSTFEYVYVPDAGTNVVRVFTPSGAPAGTIIGPPGKGFRSLMDSAIAVDRMTGLIYVADRVRSYSELPESAIYIFDRFNGYIGRLKYNVIDGSPVGLAVDNQETDTTGEDTRGRTYVTSGNGSFEQGRVYQYLPNSATNIEAPATAPLP